MNDLTKKLLVAAAEGIVTGAALVVGKLLAREAYLWLRQETAEAE